MFDAACSTGSTWRQRPPMSRRDRTGSNTSVRSFPTQRLLVSSREAGVRPLAVTFDGRLFLMDH